MTQKFTDANNDKGRSTIEHAERHNIEHDPVEVIRQRKAQNDGDNAPECQPDGKRRQDQHQNDDHDNGDYCKTNVVPERGAHFVVKNVVTAVEHADFAGTQTTTLLMSAYFHYVVFKFHWSTAAMH